MRYRVIADWTASYADPLQLAAGAPVQLTGRAERWDGHLWLWARAGDGREGWIPDSLVRQGASGPVASDAYAATELTCRAGEVVSAARAIHGWVWCRTATGRAGWVPARNLAPLAPERVAP